MFDPKKHRKTAEYLATLSTAKSKDWLIQKPKRKDYVRAYGNDLEELNVVNIFEQRDGGGVEAQWLVQGKTEADDAEIIDALGATDIIAAIVVPMFIKANNSNYIWLAKQGKIGNERTHPVHSQIREAITTAQKMWCRIYWEDSTKQYLCEPPENAEAFGDPTWPSQEMILKHLQKSFTDKIIDTADHEIVKRTRGLII
tara:strand:- start:924 stop:1520 length:597 start_codon:yes stop_codon:yes gene_type:complete